MLKENPQWNNNIGKDFSEIQLGVSFRPYRNMRRFRVLGEGRKPFLVPESYDHVLALRKRVSLYGIPGVIDVVSEDPMAPLLSMISKARRYRGVETPLGPTSFETIYRGRDKGHEFITRPYILRFSFLLRNPNEYSKLLVSYADIKIGEEEYVFLWNQDRPDVKRKMQKLERGQELLIVEKNLFKAKDQEGTEEVLDYEKEELGRVSFVWLPKGFRKTENNQDDV